MPRVQLVRQLLLAAVAALAVTLSAASPASAVTLQVNVSAQGSGQVTAQQDYLGSNPPTRFCVKSQPNTTKTSCGGNLSFTSSPGTSLNFTAAPAEEPEGHWQFLRWETTGWQTGDTEQCNGSTATSCNLSLVSPSDTGAQRNIFLTAVFADTVGATIATAPTFTHSITQERTVGFEWTADEPLASAECKLDSGEWLPCTGATSHTATVAEGNHFLRVRGHDANGGPVGNQSPFVAFTVVDTQLLDGPTGITADRTPSFRFSSSAGDTFWCRVGQGNFTNCSALDAEGGHSWTATSLPDGNHTFTVYAQDSVSGAHDRIVATRTFTVDGTPATAAFELGFGPGEGALQAVNHETFRFTASEAGSTFECRLAPAATFTACTSPHAVADLRPGVQKFEVRATDPYGNVGTPAARNWSVAPQDRDGDGFNELIDCDDGNPAIRPGAVEIVDNAVDENCDGIVARTPVVDSPVVIPPAVNAPSPVTPPTQNPPLSSGPAPIPTGSATCTATIVKTAARAVKGKSLAKARSTLKKAGCAVGKVTKPKRVKRGFTLVVSKVKLTKGSTTRVDVTLVARRR